MQSQKSAHQQFGENGLSRDTVAQVFTFKDWQLQPYATCNTERHEVREKFGLEGYFGNTFMFHKNKYLIIGTVVA